MKNTLTTNFLFTLLLSVTLISCDKKPTLSDIQNVKRIVIKTNQSFKADGELVQIQLNDVLSELFEKIGVECVSETDPHEAVLSIDIGGIAHATEFPTKNITFFESTDIEGKAKLKMNGFSPVITNLNYKLRYSSTTYYEGRNFGPDVVITKAVQIELDKMLYNLWGPEVFFKIWDIPFIQNQGRDLSGEVYTISDDPLAILPVLFNTLENDTSIYYDKARYLLFLLTQSEKKSGYGDTERRSDKVLERNEEVIKEIDRNPRYKEIKNNVLNQE